MGQASWPVRAFFSNLLSEEAQELGRHRTKREAVNAALDEYIQRRKQQGILSLFGSIDYEENHDYKHERPAKRR